MGRYSEARDPGESFAKQFIWRDYSTLGSQLKRKSRDARELCTVHTSSVDSTLCSVPHCAIQ